MNTARTHALYMLAFVVFWTVEEALTALVLPRYALPQVVWMRFGVHLAVMLAWWGWREPRSLLHTRRPVFQVGRGLLMAGVPACWGLAMHRGAHLGTLMSMFWIAPLLILLLAHLVLGERASRATWAACALAWAGAWIALAPTPVLSKGAAVLGFGMALCLAGYVVMTRSLRTEPLRANLFYVGLAVFAALTPVVPGVWVEPAAIDVLAMSGAGVFTLAGLAALERLGGGSPVPQWAPFIYLQLPCAVMLVWLLHSHGPTPRTVAGLSIIVAAALYASRREALRLAKAPA